MLRLTTLTTLLTATSMLSACGRDAQPAAPDQVPALSEPAPVDGEQPRDPRQDEPADPNLDLVGSCGVAAPAVQFEVLDAPAADTLTDLRLRWPSDAPMPALECCPYQHLPGPFVQGGRLVEYQEGADDEGRFVDMQIAVDDTPGAQLTAGLSFCATHVTESWTIAPSPFVETAAALATCEPAGDWIEFDAQDTAELRVTAFEINGAVAPGATIELQVAMAEITGVGHANYPGFMFELDPPVADFNENLGVFYATIGCEEMGMTVPVTLPDDLEPGTTLTVIVKAGQPLCREDGCAPHDAVSLTRRVMPAL
ncbi:MAG: hypothetical protein ACI9U2_004049 [Bradymonadia bacterium]|jgi:hypothetical protein